MFAPETKFTVPERARARAGRPQQLPTARSCARVDRRADRPLGRRTPSRRSTFRDGPDGKPLSSRFALRAGARRASLAPPRQQMGQERPDPAARGVADRRVARGPRSNRPTTGSPTCPPTPNPSASHAWPGCAGRSSSTTTNSRASSASTTTRAAPGWAGTTTPRSSPPPTASSPWSGSSPNRPAAGLTRQSNSFSRSSSAGPAAATPANNPSTSTKSYCTPRDKTSNT